MRLASTRLLVVMLGVCAAACGSDASGDDTVADAAAPDADPNAPDASALLPDATPEAADADPACAPNPVAPGGNTCA